MGLGARAETSMSVGVERGLARDQKRGLGAGSGREQGWLELVGDTGASSRRLMQVREACWS